MDYGIINIAVITSRQVGKTSLFNAYIKHEEWLRNTFRAGAGEEHIFHIFYHIIAESKGISVLDAKDIYNPLPLYELWEKLYFASTVRKELYTWAPLVVDKVYSRQNFFNFVLILASSRY